MKIRIFILISLPIFVLILAGSSLENSALKENSRALKGFVLAGNSENYQILRGLFTGAAIDASSESFGMEASLGQTASGPAESESYKMSQGYWPDFGGSGCCDTPGDADNGGTINILDVTFIINYLYKNGPHPDCYDEADADGSNIINILDVTTLINYLYKNGPPPVCGTTET